MIVLSKGERDGAKLISDIPYVVYGIAGQSFSGSVSGDACQPGTVLCCYDCVCVPNTV